MGEERILEVKNLKKHFNLGKDRVLKAVNDVTFHINKGETFGLVGESGCGKSTIGRTIISLYQKTAGDVIFDGQNVHDLSEKEMFKLRQKMQMIFQDPYASLNPRSTVREVISEPMEV